MPPYLIRSARPSDLLVLPLIEQAAATWFLDTPYTYLVDEGVISGDVNLDHEYVWVVVDEHDYPIGFALVVHLRNYDGFTTGYNFFSLIRASAVVNRQFTVALAVLRRTSQAAVS